MRDKWSKHYEQIKAFLFSVLLLGSIGILLFFLLLTRAGPKQKEEVDRQILHQVPYTSLYQGTEKIQVAVYGTVKAASTTLYQAPFSDTVRVVEELIQGKYIEKGTLIFRMDTESLDLAIEQLQVRFKELELRSKQLEEEGKIIRERFDSIRELIVISQNALEKRDQELSIQKRLHGKVVELAGQDTVSNSELLQSNKGLIAAELAVLEARKNVESNEEALNNLRSLQNSNRYALEENTQKKRSLEIEIADLKVDLAKAEIRAETSGKVVEVFIDEEQEVQVGTSLARIRSVDEVELTVTVPDSYFKWLYSGPLFEQAGAYRRGNIPIHLVNYEFSKSFSGGYIKAIGESVRQETRSLPIVIGRKNPLDQAGIPIPDEELKPGMYCEVELELDEIHRVFLIPPSALQRNDWLYVLEGVEADGTAILRVIRDLDVVFESDRGMMIRLKEDFKQINLITQKFHFAEEGMRLQGYRLEGG